MTPVRASLACWPGSTHLVALHAAKAGAKEPMVGRLLTDHVQLVPQCIGLIDEGLAEVLVKTWPTTSFRLHANVHVLRRRQRADLCTFERDQEWFTAAARIHRALGATAYSAHAGLRRDATLHEMLDNARRCADLFGSPVAVEGQYPVAGDEPDRLLVSSWQEYRTLFESGVPYALDLSHLNILAHRSGALEVSLVAEMLASPACIEVHVSDNDGCADRHQVLQREPWWWSLLHHTQPAAVVFSEGNHGLRNTERIPV